MATTTHEITTDSGPRLDISRLGRPMLVLGVILLVVYGVLMAGGNAVVGLEINANHLRAVRSGIVTGTARAIHLGRSTQVWEIRIEDAAGKLVCISRITLAVLPQPPASGG